MELKNLQQQPYKNISAEKGTENKGALSPTPGLAESVPGCPLVFSFAQPMEKKIWVPTHPHNYSKGLSLTKTLNIY